VGQRVFLLFPLFVSDPGVAVHLVASLSTLFTRPFLFSLLLSA
jgi:hypothetical protein